MRVSSIRQSDEQAAELELVCHINGIPLAEAFREAIASWIAEKRADPEFQARLQRHLKAIRSLEHGVAGGDA